ncbi:uncharacterized protein LOC120572649 [Perca fluviatilis]|uniref:uncharacterized protein LOC120572649 n=1 Tax=Perca fluviatilis TaxID=8168 RepID=UPI001964C5A3|nr:uncharacterized protein LOC120572649 [Perca fluviatilis]
MGGSSQRRDGDAVAMFYFNREFEGMIADEPGGRPSASYEPPLNRTGEGIPEGASHQKKPPFLCSTSTQTQYLALLTTWAEQLKATEDLVSLYLTPEDDFTQAPTWSRNGCLHNPKKGSKKRSIKTEEAFQKGLPPKRQRPSFVPHSPYPDTVSDAPNNSAEQLTVSATLESLHWSSSKCDFTHSTPKTYHPPSVSIEREQKDTPLQKTFDKTIQAVEAGEGSEDIGLTKTAHTSHQPNREATGEGSEDTGLAETPLTAHQSSQASLQAVTEYNVGEYLFNCIYSTEEGSDYVRCIPHTSVVNVSDKKCNRGNTSVTNPVNVLEVNVPFLDNQAVPNYITNNPFEYGGSPGGPEQITLLQGDKLFEYCANTTPQQPASDVHYKQIQSELAEFRKQNKSLFGTTLASQVRANAHLADLVTGFGTTLATQVSYLNTLIVPMIVCLKNTMNNPPQ